MTKRRRRDELISNEDDPHVQANMVRTVAKDAFCTFVPAFDDARQIFTHDRIVESPQSQQDERPSVKGYEVVEAWLTLKHVAWV